MYEFAVDTLVDGAMDSVPVKTSKPPQLWTASDLGTILQAVCEYIGTDYRTVFAEVRSNVRCVRITLGGGTGRRSSDHCRLMRTQH
jgi:hypothetical protein